MARTVSSLRRSILRDEDGADGESTGGALATVRDSPDVSGVDGDVTPDAPEPEDLHDESAVDVSPDDTEGEVPAEAGGADAAEDERALGRGKVAAFAAVTVLVLGVLAAGVGAGWFLVQHREANATRDRDRMVVETAGRVAADLVTLRAGSADDDIKRIQESSTGEFRQQIGDSTSGFAAVLKQGAVESTGKAAQLAIERSGENQSVVLAAVTSTLKNSESPDAQQRVYRMRLTLDRSGAKWLVSKVEFVA